MTVAVMTDSAAALPQVVADRNGVTIVPVWLIIGGRSVHDHDVSQQEVLDRWDEGISTSVPTPAEFSQLIDERMTDDGVLVVTVSSSLTGIHQAAEIAARDMTGPVKVLDTGTAVGAET